VLEGSRQGKTTLALGDHSASHPLKKQALWNKVLGHTETAKNTSVKKGVLMEREKRGEVEGGTKNRILFR